jgi:GntR family transcriptional regulator
MFRVNPSSGVPLYLQLMDQVKHAIETGAVKAGDQLPTIRNVAEHLVMNPNTVVRAYRELQHEGFIELKHGSGAFVSESIAGRARVTRKAQSIVHGALERLTELGLTEEEIRRLFDNDLAQLRAQRPSGEKHE